MFRETPHETVLSNLPASPLALYRDDHDGALGFKGETLAHTTLWGEVRWEDGEWGEREGRVEVGLAAGWPRSHKQLLASSAAASTTAAPRGHRVCVCVTQGLSQQS